MRCICYYVLSRSFVLYQNWRAAVLTVCHTAASFAYVLLRFCTNSIPFVGEDVGLRCTGGSSRGREVTSREKIAWWRLVRIERTRLASGSATPGEEDN